MIRSVGVLWLWCGGGGWCCRCTFRGTYSAFQKELHKIFTNFRLPFIKSRRSDRYLSDITFQSLRPELSFGVSFMFISGHFWSADTKQKK